VRVLFLLRIIVSRILLRAILNDPRRRPHQLGPAAPPRRPRRHRAQPFPPVPQARARVLDGAGHVVDVADEVVARGAILVAKLGAAFPFLLVLIARGGIPTTAGVMVAAFLFSWGRTFRAVSVRRAVAFARVSIAAALTPASRIFRLVPLEPFVSSPVVRAAPPPVLEVPLPSPPLLVATLAGVALGARLPHPEGAGLPAPLPLFPMWGRAAAAADVSVEVLARGGDRRRVRARRAARSCAVPLRGALPRIIATARRRCWRYTWTRKLLRLLLPFPKRNDSSLVVFPRRMVLRSAAP